MGEIEKIKIKRKQNEINELEKEYNQIIYEHYGKIGSDDDFEDRTYRN